MRGVIPSRSWVWESGDVDSTPDPATSLCHRDRVARCPCASVVLVTERDCGFLLSRREAKRPNASLQMTLRSQAESC